MKKRPMPDDFTEHAGDGIKVLMARYHTGQRTVERWRSEAGIPKRTYRRRPVIQIDMKGRPVRIHDSAYYAGAALGVNHRGIISAADQYPYRTAYGFRWQYLEDTAHGNVQS